MTNIAYLCLFVVIGLFSEKTAYVRSDYAPAGYVACSGDGRFVPVVNTGKLGFCPVIASCVEAHEITHVLWSLRTQPEACDNRERGYKPSVAGDTLIEAKQLLSEDECEAYRVSYVCLGELFDKAHYLCIQREMEHVLYMRDYYGCEPL